MLASAAIERNTLRSSELSFDVGGMALLSEKSNVQIEGLRAFAQSLSNAGLAFGSTPHPIELGGRKERRFRIPIFVCKPDWRHRLRRFFVPIGAYLDEINICRRIAKFRDTLGGELLIRKTVERTLRLKFRHGQRGFRHWLLKHQSWARLTTKGGNDFWKDNRGKIKEPTICLNPAMKVFFADGDRLTIGICKRNGFRSAKVKGGGTNNSFSLQFVMSVKD